eukprot:TRINITY_DN4769_c1_g1_i1.p1 TRINITY_DN4769_c1_g1~~TRINITY_DN4769_c1_g1_i1.p1  ORF type:complete len:916 (+),score=177.71 TRINITY_DN4769_c1_g1_i1:66-2750(+)
MAATDAAAAAAAARRPRSGCCGSGTAAKVLGAAAACCGALPLLLAADPSQLRGWQQQLERPRREAVPAPRASPAPGTASPGAAARGPESVCTNAPLLRFPRAPRGRTTVWRVRVALAEPAAAAAGGVQWDSGEIWDTDPAYNQDGQLGGCQWRQTRGCRPQGTREPQNDLPCGAAVPPGASGWCECGDGTVIAVACKDNPDPALARDNAAKAAAAPRSCAQRCGPPAATAAPAAAAECDGGVATMGARVRRGPHWSWGAQDGGGGGLGTVHAVQGDWVVVDWDSRAVHANRYRCSRPNPQDLSVVPDAPPRPLQVGDPVELLQRGGAPPGGGRGKGPVGRVVAVAAGADAATVLSVKTSKGAVLQVAPDALRPLPSPVAAAVADSPPPQPPPPRREYNATWARRRLPPRGFETAYAGPPLLPRTPYRALLLAWEVAENGTRRALAPQLAGFRACPGLPSARAEAARLLAGRRHRDLYFGTLASLRGRVHPDGFVPTSVARREAKSGMFVRDTAALLLALLAVGGELATIALVLRFISSAMRGMQAPRVPRYISKDEQGSVHVGGGGARDPSAADQPDAAFMLLLAWARYLYASGDAALARQTWLPLRRVLDNYLAIAPVGEAGGPKQRYYDAALGLLWNPEFEHSRRSTRTRFLSTYDLVTNAFAVGALAWLVPLVAEGGVLHGHAEAAPYALALQQLSDGVHRSLWCEGAYAELRFRDSPDRALCGYSFASLAPAAALGIHAADGGPARQWLRPAAADAAVHAYYRLGSFEWRDANSGGRPWRVPHAFADPPPQAGGAFAARWGSAGAAAPFAVLGKGVAWELAWRCAQGQWARALGLLRWLGTHTVSPLYGEQYFYEDYLRGDEWWHDPGNAEQSGWLVWAVAHCRRLAGAQ